MLTGSTPKLLQQAGRIKEVLEKIGKELPGGVSAKAAAEKIAALEKSVGKVDAVNVERRGAVNDKQDKSKDLNDFIMQARLAIKAVCGADSPEYEMAGCVRTSERKRPVRKPKQEKA